MPKLATPPKRRTSVIKGLRQSYVLIPDSHVPFHNVPFLKKICQVIHDIRPTGIVLTGDFLDLFSLSSYAADSVAQLRDVTLEDEYAAGNKVLDDLDDAMGRDAERYYLYGNHEDRYFREIQKGDRGKYGAALLSPTEALDLRERGYVVRENWKDDVVQLGEHLEVTHGIYCNLHAAYKHATEFQGSVIFGHTHRVQSYVLGKRAGYNIGCTCDIESKGFGYMPRTQRLKWCNGFAVVHVDDAGDFHVETIQAYNGRFVANGRYY